MAPRGAGIGIRRIRWFSARSHVILALDDLQVIEPDAKDREQNESDDLDRGDPHCQILSLFVELHKLLVLSISNLFGISDR